MSVLVRRTDIQRTVAWGTGGQPSGKPPRTRAFLLAVRSRRRPGAARRRRRPPPGSGPADGPRRRRRTTRTSGGVAPSARTARGAPRPPAGARSASRRPRSSPPGRLARSAPGQPFGDLLEQPAVAVRVGERCEGRVAAVLGVGPRRHPIAVAVDDLAAGDTVL